MALENQLSYFRKRQEEFARDKHEKYVLIHDETVGGFFDSSLAAFEAARGKKYLAGTFLIRPCLRTDEETVQLFHSRVAT